MLYLACRQSLVLWLYLNASTLSTLRRARRCRISSNSVSREVWQAQSQGLPHTASPACGAVPGRAEILQPLVQTPPRTKAASAGSHVTPVQGCSHGGPTATVALCGEKRVPPNALREKSCGVPAPARPQDREQLAKAPLATSPQHWDFHHTRDRCQVRAYFKTCWQGIFSLLVREGWQDPAQLGLTVFVAELGFEETTQLSEALSSPYLSHHALEQSPHQLHHALQEQGKQPR